MLHINFNNMFQYLNLKYKLVWFEYLDIESIEISSIFNV